MAQIIKKIFLVIGSLALAMVLISVVAPKPTHALVAALVQIANTPANPVPTEEALGTAVLAHATCPAFSIQGRDGFGGNCSDALSGSLFSVPAGKRLSIEQLYGTCSTLSGRSFVVLHIDTVRTAFPPAFTQSFQLPLQFLGSDSVSDFYVISQIVRGYAEAGSSFTLQALSTDGSGSTNCNIDIVGRLVPTS